MWERLPFPFLAGSATLSSYTTLTTITIAPCYTSAKRCTPRVVYGRHWLPWDTNPTVRSSREDKCAQ